MQTISVIVLYWLYAEIVLWMHWFAWNLFKLISSKYIFFMWLPTTFKLHLWLVIVAHDSIGQGHDRIFDQFSSLKYSFLNFHSHDKCNDFFSWIRHYFRILYNLKTHFRLLYYRFIILNLHQIRYVAFAWVWHSLGKSITLYRLIKYSMWAQSYSTFCDPMDSTHQSPLSMGFPRQEYWSGLPFPSPGDLPNPGLEPGSYSLLVTSEKTGSSPWRSLFPFLLTPSCHWQTQKLHSTSLPGLWITPWTPGHSLDFRLLQDQWVHPTPALVVLIYNPGRDRKKNHCLINCIYRHRGKRGPEEKQKETEEGKLILVFSPSHT